MKIGKMALILLVIVGIMGILISGCDPGMVKIGKISDIRVTPYGDGMGEVGGYLTQLVFDDGTNLVLVGAHSEFIIGHRYEILYRKTVYGAGEHGYPYLLLSFKEVS